LYGRACLPRPLRGVAELHEHLHIDGPGFNQVLQVLKFLIGLLQAG
jgi:hypothetical protein